MRRSNAKMRKAEKRVTDLSPAPLDFHPGTFLQSVQTNLQKDRTVSLDTAADLLHFVAGINAIVSYEGLPHRDSDETSPYEESTRKSCKFGCCHGVVDLPQLSNRRAP